MNPAFDIDLASADAVRGVFVAGARANREAACRRGSVDAIEPPGTLIATGDLHDNPLHFQRLVQVAGLTSGPGDEETKTRSDDEQEAAHPHTPSPRHLPTTSSSTRSSTPTA